MKKHKFSCVCARMEEGEELEKSEEFMKFMHDILMTTGGDASNLNSVAEAPHKMSKKTTRVLLITAAIVAKFWCFAMQYAVFSHCQQSSPWDQASSSSLLL